jgi:hypothetical protein
MTIIEWILVWGIVSCLVSPLIAAFILGSATAVPHAARGRIDSELDELLDEWG